MLRRVSWVFLVAGCSLIGGALTPWIMSRWDRPVMAQAVGAETNRSVVTDLVSVSERFELIAKKASPAVVYVEAIKPPDAQTPPGKVMEESGSGVIVQLENRPGYFVLTNHHVISGSEARKIIVHLADGRIIRPAKVWGDPESDIAVLGIAGHDNLPSAPLGDSDKVRVGSWVLAIGSPFGLNQTVTHGILSARERGQVSLGSTIRIKDFLQTDAAINPGSSGGPLLNFSGEVIGINTAIASQSGSSSGVAFSIPINLVKKIAVQLLDNGSVSRGYFGIQLSHSFEPGDALRLGMNRATGALVEIVYPGTPAADAGIRVNDIILEFAGQEIKNENQLINLVSSLPSGKEVSIVVWRERKRLSLTGRIGDWAKMQERIRSNSP